MIERFVIVNPNAEIKVEDIETEVGSFFKNILTQINEAKNGPRIGSLKDHMQRLEKEMIMVALKMHPTLADAANDLGIDISTLTRKKQKYGLRGNWD
jgi:DNA-binding NtrC family response regulator